jgi:hypothetical protein
MPGELVEPYLFWNEDQPPAGESDVGGVIPLLISVTMDEFGWSHCWNRTGQEILGISRDDDVRETILSGRALHGTSKSGISKLLARYAVLESTGAISAQPRILSISRMVAASVRPRRIR